MIPHLVDITMFFAPRSGGVKRYLLHKHAWLAHRGALRHTLLLPGATGGGAPDAGVVSVASPRLPFGHGYRLPLNLAAWDRALRALAPDVIEAGDPYQLAWLALRAGRALDVPVVGFYHSDLPRLLGARFGRGARAAAQAYVRRLYRRFDAVLAPSQVMVERLQELGVAQARRQPLGVDTARFHPARRDPSLRRRLGLAEDARLLVYVGRFAREKNLPVLLAAMRRLGPRYHLLLVGAGMSLPRPANVTSWPYQADTDALAAVMAGCDALVHAGDKETFGLVVLEAMACGLPVVGVAAGAVAELVDPGVGVLAAPGSAPALAEAVAALYEQDLPALGRAARRKVEAHYGWDRVLARLMGHYDLLLGRAPAPEPRLAHARD